MKTTKLLSFLSFFICYMQVTIASNNDFYSECYDPQNQQVEPEEKEVVEICYEKRTNHKEYGDLEDKNCSSEKQDSTEINYKRSDS